MAGPRENRYDDKDVDNLREDLEEALKDGDMGRFSNLLGDDDDDDDD